jgi:hypothetical protein
LHRTSPVVELIKVQKPSLMVALVPGSVALKLGAAGPAVPFSGTLISGAVEFSLHAASSIAAKPAAETSWRMGQSS